MIAKGDLCYVFESSIKDWLGATQCLSCSSGTAALYEALLLLGIPKGASVVLPTYVCRNVADAVRRAELRPVLVDVNESGVITADTVSKFFDSNVGAIIAVHLFGNPCDIDGLRQFRVPIIEDACQALGLKVGQRFAGTLGDVGTLSFQATKQITTGEGGMVVLGSRVLPSSSKSISDELTYGLSEYYPISDLQAALGISQFSRYDRMLQRRKLIRETYLSALDQRDTKLSIDLSSNAPFRFVFQAAGGFEKTEEYFRQRDVTVRRGVDELLHRDCGGRDSDFPVAVKLFEVNVSLPFYPALSDAEVEHITKCLSLAH